MRNKRYIQAFFGIAMIVYAVYTIVGTVLNHNEKVRKDVKSIQLAANIEYIKNGIYPFTPNRLVQNQNIKTYDTSIENFKYESINKGSYCEIMGILWIESSYSLRCSENVK